MFNIKKTISVFSRYTIISFVKSFILEAKKYKKQYKMINLKLFWSKYSPNEKDHNDKVVLIDVLFEHVGTNNNSLLVSSLISSKVRVKKIGLIDFHSRLRLKNFCVNYGVKDFVSLYALKNIIYHNRSFIFVLKNWSKFKYKKESGISVKVDGQEIGDLIYDQFMRENLFSTVRVVSFLYKIYIFKYVSLYYRYCEIIQSNNVTDIVLSHNVYARFGLIARAAATIDCNINIWQWYGLSPLNINSHKAKKSFIRMPRYYETQYRDFINDNLGIEGVNNLFEEYSKIRFQGLDPNQIDLSFVYKNNDINTEIDFYEYYKPKDKVVVVFSHAFVDAVKYTDWQLYSDYYTWLENTLIMLRFKSLEGSIFIKAHPSESLYPCKDTVENLVEKINLKYGSEFVYLDKNVSNTTIFKVVNSIVTCSGTVAMEASCFGIPCIISASALYEQSGSVYQSNSIDQYIEYLNQVYTLKTLDKEKIYQAKLAFLWFSKFVYSEADFLEITDGDINADYFSACEKIDSSYKKSRSLYEQELYKSFCDVYNGKNNDTIRSVKGIKKCVEL